MAHPNSRVGLLEVVGNGDPRGMIVALQGVTAAGNRTRLTVLSDHTLIDQISRMRHQGQWLGVAFYFI